jgi:hypothetical protein
MSGISRGLGWRARRIGFTGLVTALAGALAGACAGGPGAERVAPGAGPAGGAIPLSQALVLGTSGAMPHDTAVTFAAGERRVIVLRHAPPDNLAFAELVFPPSAFAADSGRDVTVRLRARPGVYGLDVDTSSPIGKGATVTFHYARYFSAPAAARQVYGTDVAFERALSVARLEPDSTLVLLTSTRPASDDIAAAVPAAGTYLVAAAR